MRKDILIANYHKPYPPRDGADGRCIDLIKAFKVLGYNITLFSSDLFQQAPWTREAVVQIERELGIKVVLYIGDNRDKKEIGSREFRWDNYMVPGLKKYFDLLYAALQPDLVLVNYVLWADLAIGPMYKNSVTIIDAIDLLSLNQKMAELTWEYLRKGTMNEQNQFLLTGVNDRLLDESFFSGRNLQADEREFQKYDQFDITLAISARENELLKRSTVATKCVYMPFSFATKQFANTYSQPPVFAIGPNQFNYQGYLYFVKKVLPLLLQKNPDFVLDVIGDGCRFLQAAPGINMRGFVPDLVQLYTHSKFAVCPLIGATGQQLKVMEAMAKGLPVVVLRNVAERCPVVHDVNGLIADNAQEFADYMLLLYSDPALCSRLGMSARKTIELEFTTGHLVGQLADAVSEASKEKQPESHTARKLVGSVLFNVVRTGRKIKLRLKQAANVHTIKYLVKSLINRSSLK